MFDDCEAALDALLGQAQWEEPAEAMTRRLAALVQTREPKTGAAPVMAQLPEPGAPGAVPDATTEVAEGHHPDLYSAKDLDEQAAPSPVEDPSWNTAQDDTAPILTISSEPKRWLREFAALAASVLLLIGAGVVLVHLIPSPKIVKRDAAPLPGRAPTPMELWLISPAGQKYLASKTASTPTEADTHLVKIARLCRNGDSNSLVYAMLHDPDVESQTQLLAALLRRPEGRERFLDLVRNRQTGQKAILILQSLPDPPTDALMAQLDSPSVARRFAAARALGALCNGDDLPTLARMIQTHDHQREALAVLSQCHDPRAAKYVRELRRQPALSNQLNVVRSQMEQLF